MPIEAWLRGPVEGIPPLLMPVAHALVQAREELDVTRGLTTEELWVRPGGAASVGFHLRHIPGSIDRLFSYASERTLTEEQMAYLKAEAEPGVPPAGVDELLGGIDQIVERLLMELGRTDEADLLEPRWVGRARLPTNLLGLLYHIGEHTQRHVGQVVTTMRILKGITPGSP